MVVRRRGALWAAAPVLGLLLGLPLAAGPAAGATGPDRPATATTRVSFLDEEWGDDTTGEDQSATAEGDGTWDAQHDRGSLWYVGKQTGAHEVWGKSDPAASGRKLTGHGVGVALIDTGIAPVTGLNGAGKIVNGPDLSFESQADNTRYLDGYGHGTHMAGIIAGRDTAAPEGDETDDKHFVGMAPDATLINMKVAAADGGADVTQIIAAVDWVVQHKADHNIRVLNLSYGTSSVQDRLLDPLAHAVENAWRAGIVVVVAAGNDGESGATRLTMPAVDPYVVAVGSADHNGSDDRAETTVGTWTNDGTADRRPDLVAPGKSVVSLRVPGSMADREHPEGLVYGDRTGRLFRGTGTSQSAAVVSGAAALLVQRNPELTPDQVKGLLTAGADRLSSTDPTQGAGLLDVKGAVELLEQGEPATFGQTWPESSGLGSLEAARGGSHVADPDNGLALTGEQDIFGMAWDAASWAEASAQRRSWSGGEWRGATWSGASWSGTSWSSADWTRRSWSDVDWSRRSWSTMTFLRRSWSGDDWSRRSWSADNWTRRSWSSNDFVLSQVW
jgi:serine protease AprX